MQIITLLSDPATPCLESAALEALRRTWGAGEARWLASGVAAEFSLERVPEDRWQVWEEFQRHGIDLVVQPAGERRKRMLLADMDSTMIGQECIDELAAEAGVGMRVAAITMRAMNGELDFEAALRERVGLLKGLPTSVIDKVLAERITLAPGGQTLIATMRAAGARTVLVSGGFTAFAARVAERLGFDEYQANHLISNGGYLSGTVAEPILGRSAKIMALNRISSRLGVRPEDVIAVGDGANDLGMLERAGIGVALHAKPAVAAQCDIRVNHGDLTALLYLQGYTAGEFVRRE